MTVFNGIIEVGINMNIMAYFRYLKTTRRTKPHRYRALFKTIVKNRCRKLVEIGVYDGAHAQQMIQAAGVHHDPQNIYYYGFDLFEDLSEELLIQEGSKKPPHCTTVRDKLNTSGANIRLFKGDTKLTLPESIEIVGEADFVFIDGGHSVKTIASDWKYVKKMMSRSTIVIFDDYYLNDDPEIEGLGCQNIIDGLDRQIFDVLSFKTVDRFRKEWGELKIKMVLVRKNAGALNQ
jgi:hypothetical protein